MTNTSLTSRPGNGLARSEIPLADLIHVSEKEEPPSSGFQACSNGQTISPSLPSTSLNFQFPFKPKKVYSFPISPSSKNFYTNFWPGTSAEQWNDWQWQLKNRIRSLKDLERIFELSEDEREAASQHRDSLPVGITPYYASLMSRTDSQDPLRRTHVQVGQEFIRSYGEDDDPLGEDGSTVVEGLVHRYPDRVLFLSTGFCSTYCRYCTRSRMVGSTGKYRFGTERWNAALNYLRSHKEVRDVLLSGGDPLTLPDDRLDWLLTQLRSIKHIEFVRIGTKVPIVLPQRITKDLVKILRKHKPWMSLHFTHPTELTPEVKRSTARLADAGLPLGSQTVLLAGINDSVETLKNLFHGLLKNRVRPYYLFQCDPIKGSAHFRTPVEKGLEIIKGLRGHTTGYAVPTFVIDAPGGGGKIPLLPEYLLGREGGDLVFNNFAGHQHRYPDPDGTLAKDRIFTADNLPSEIVLNGSVHTDTYGEGGVPCA
ncbi:MAG: KamA family radical SAM protein [Proteobacteria bacterium]|jgi:lysine 2,3-aminomutase|nr:KamA family radical SAM protein [Pseudomonadota bacterium]